MRGESAQFEPALRLSRAAVSWLNDIAPRRMVLQSRLAEKPLSVRMNRVVWRPQPSAVSMLDCVFRVGAEKVVLSLPRPLVETLISIVQNDLALPSDPARSLLLELALEEWLTRLENLIGRDVQLVRIDQATAQGPHLELEIACGPLMGNAHLFLFSSLDGLVPSAFHMVRKLFVQLPQERRKLSPELPVMLAAEIGSLRISAALLRQARSGDALLPDVIPFLRGQLILTTGTLWAPSQVAGETVILRGPFRQQFHPLRYAEMTTRPKAQPAMPPSEADIDSLEITLVFECGRWPIPLGTLRTINEGHVFEVGRAIDHPVDIVANGRVIGHGDIVRVGEKLAVRLLGELAVND